MPIQRLAQYIVQWLKVNIQWATFEPYSPALFARLTALVSAFMDGLLTRGALLGSRPDQAYSLHCGPYFDDDLTVRGIEVDIGFAAVKPAELIRITVKLDKPD